MFFHFLALLSFTFSQQLLHAQVTHDKSQLNEPFLAKAQEINDFKSLNFDDFTAKWGKSNVSLHQNSKVSRWLFPYHRQPGPLHTLQYKPSIVFKEITKYKEDTNKIIIEADYEIDEFSKRVTPIEDKKSRNRYVALIGCSFVFGVGLNGNQTISAIISKMNKNVSAYNFGNSGAGTNSFLAFVETTDFSKQINEKSGDFVYVFWHEHVDRSIPSWPNIEWSYTTPHYEFNDSLNKFTVSGTLEEKYPIKVNLLKFIGKNLIRPILQNRVFPITNADDNRYVCKLIKQMKDQIIKNSPGAGFYVYNHPLSETADEFKACIKENNINFLDSKKLENEFKKLKSDQIRLRDGHPTELVNRLIASDIDMQLNPLK